MKKKINQLLNNGLNSKRKSLKKLVKAWNKIHKGLDERDRNKAYQGLDEMDKAVLEMLLQKRKKQGG